MHIPEPLHGKLLLIDRPERLGQEQRLFEEAGLTVVTAINMEEGWKIMQQEAPDLVLAEVMMEKPDAGFTLAYRMKKNDKLADVPLLLLSSVFQTTGTVLDLNSPTARKWIKADAYLERPVTHERLVAKVANMIQQHNHQMD